VPTLRELFGGPRTVDIKDMAAGDLGFVVVGPRDDRRGQQMAGVWRSADGADWVWPPQDTPLTGAPDEVVTPLGVAVGRAGIVVVGTTLPLTHVLPRAEDGAVWWSRDGRQWERVQTGATFSGDGTQQPTVVTWTGTSFVAVGAAMEEVGGRLHPAAWVSPDGRSWRRAPKDAFTEGATAGGGSGGSGGTRDSGGGGGSGGGAGTGGSADGGGSGEGRLPQGDARLTSLAVADGCVIAGGLVGSTALLWASRDGLAWAPLPSPAGALDPHGKVVVGATHRDLLVAVSEPGRSRVWTGALPQPR
jgi:hypothetical protein